MSAYYIKRMSPMVVDEEPELDSDLCGSRLSGTNQSAISTRTGESDAGGNNGTRMRKCKTAQATPEPPFGGF